MLRKIIIRSTVFCSIGCLTLGCTAAVDRDSRGSDNSNATGTPNVPGGTGVPPASTSPGAAPAPNSGQFLGPNSMMGGATGTPTELAPTTLRRLTHDEYLASVRDLLGLPSLPTATLQPDTRVQGYDNFGVALTVPPVLAGQYEDVVANLAKQADIAALAPCSTPNDDAACAATFVSNFGQRALRRPLSQGEVQEYMARYTLGRTGGSYEEGIQLVLQAFLASPKLLYRTELGTPLEGNRRLLTQHEIATALSYLFTGSTPDQSLLALAASQSLATPAQVEAEARRLMALSSARAPFRKFITQWFGLGEFDSITKDTKLFPEFSPELVLSMKAETEAFIDATVWDRAGSAVKLLSSPESFVDSRLASLYGVADPGQGALMPTTLNASVRAGLLTQASVMAMHSKANDSFPIRRGKFVRKNLLCQTLPDPPPNLMIEAPKPDPTLTTRERFALHSSSPACASCHALIDPPGFGLENFDAIGRYRTEENGKPVDSAGVLTGTPDIDGPFSGGVELAAKIVSSRLYAECATIQATRFTFGRQETPSDVTIAESIVKLVSAAGDLDMRELVVSLTKTENFFIRTHQP